MQLEIYSGALRPALMFLGKQDFDQDLGLQNLHALPTLFQEHFQHPLSNSSMKANSYQISRHRQGYQSVRDTQIFRKGI